MDFMLFRWIYSKFFLALVGLWTKNLFRIVLSPPNQEAHIHKLKSWGYCLKYFDCGHIIKQYLSSFTSFFFFWGWTINPQILWGPLSTKYKMILMIYPPRKFLFANYFHLLNLRLWISLSKQILCSSIIS